MGKEQLNIHGHYTGTRTATALAVTGAQKKWQVASKLKVCAINLLL